MKNRPNRCAKCNNKAVLMQTFDNICGTAKMYYVKCTNDFCGRRTYANLDTDAAVLEWNEGRCIIDLGGKGWKE